MGESKVLAPWDQERCRCLREVWRLRGVKAGSQRSQHCPLSAAIKSMISCKVVEDLTALACAAPRFLTLGRISIYIGGLPSPSADPFHFDTGRSACVEALRS